MSEAMQDALKFAPDSVAIINYSPAPGTEIQKADRFRHSYFRNSPSVSSDLVLMLRDDLDPGAPGRPLESIGFSFWSVPPGYPRANPADYQETDRPVANYREQRSSRRILTRAPASREGPGLFSKH